jgi:hypothetical protein
VIDICATHGFRIKVNGRVVARVRGPFEPSRFLREIERAASSCLAVPAAELRAFARPDQRRNPPAGGLHEVPLRGFEPRFPP